MNRYTITITEIEEDGEQVGEVTRYSQTVDAIDMTAIITAVNKTPQPQPVRKRAQRSDAGKPKPKKPPLADAALHT